MARPAQVTQEGKGSAERSGRLPAREGGKGYTERKGSLSAAVGGGALHGVGWGVVVAGGVLSRAKGWPTRVAAVRGRAHKWLRSSVGNGPVGKYIAARPA